MTIKIIGILVLVLWVLFPAIVGIVWINLPEACLNWLSDFDNHPAVIGRAASCCIVYLAWFAAGLVLSSWEGKHETD